jgi:hypothetical protein
MDLLPSSLKHLLVPLTIWAFELFPSMSNTMNAKVDLSAPTYADRYFWGFQTMCWRTYSLSAFIVRVLNPMNNLISLNIEVPGVCTSVFAATRGNSADSIHRGAQQS